MKKLLYSGLTALMMLFAVGFAKADNAKVKVELNPTTWTIGTTAPQFTVTIIQATTETGGGEATTAEGDALTLGASAGNVAVKVTLSKEGATSIEQVITSSPVDLTTTGLTAGTWNLTYAFVKGEDQSTTFENVDNDASTASLTVEAAPVTETTVAPTFKVGEEEKTAYELAADADASVTVTIVAADGATVYYTIDGTEPSTTTTTTGTSVTINSACILQAIAVETGKNASAVASFTVTKATAPVVTETTTTPTFKVGEEVKTAYELAADADASVTVTIVAADGATVYYTTDGTEPTTSITAATSRDVTITSACTLKAIAVETGKNASAVAFFVVTKATPRPTVTALSFEAPSRTGGSYAEPDTTYGTVMPEFSVKVEGVTLGYDATPVSAIQYKVYRFIEEKDSLVDEGTSFDATFEIGNMSDPLPNDTYKMVIRVAERSAERNEDYEWDWTPYTDAEGKVAESTVYFEIAAPAWTLVFPELKTVEGEDEVEYEDAVEPFQLRRGKDMKVVIATENCEGLFGNGEDKMIIRKKVSVPSLMKTPEMFGERGMIQTDGYTIYDTMIPADGNIVWTLSEGWVDSVKKFITAEVEAFVKAMEEDDDITADEIAGYREQLAFKDEEDLSDCRISVMAGTMFDLSEWDMEGVMFMPTMDYPSMIIEVPFTVIDTIYAPTLSLESGEVTVNTDLWITADLATDTIYYSVDEGAFQKAEPNNAVSLTIDRDMKVAAYAIGKDGRKSNTVSATYTVVEEPEDSELTVKAVEATKDGENYVFNGKNVAFDMFVKNKKEGDSLVVSIYTKEQYDAMGQVEPTKFAVADSVRFTTTLEYGEYVGDFTIVRKSDKVGETVVGEAVTIKFTVKEELANEAAELAGVNVYPNPNAGAFNVVVPERARIDIFGLNGAKVMSREVNAGVEAFNLEHSGIYFIRVMAGNKTAVKRVVVR